MRCEDDLPPLPDLAAIGFADERAAAVVLQRLRNEMDATLSHAGYEPHLLHALTDAANPDQVLLTFERFVHGDSDRPALLQFLAAQPRAVEILIRIFSGSQFLTNILLRHPEYLERLTRQRQMADLKGREEFLAEARDAMSAAGGDTTSRLNALRCYQRSELLRIGTCDFTGLLDLRRVTVQLSLLADAIVQACLEIASEQEPREESGEVPLSVCPPLATVEVNAHWQQAASGTRTSTINRGTGVPPVMIDEATVPRPLTPDPSPPAGARGDMLAVIALGKLGGEELNYSSDIDLLFIAEQVSSRHLRVARRLVQALANVTDEGFLYRVDMRLRPWGNSGELVSSLESYLDYLRQHARLWEKQSLLKARVIAGDAELGHRFVAELQPWLFGCPADDVRSSVREAKQKIEAELTKKRRDVGEVKLGRGSIRDIEFVVQALQLIHGGDRPQVRSFNTLDALVRLADAGLLAASEFQTLTTGYVFLRTVEHSLQLVHQQQTHLLPQSKPERQYLARRLDFPDEIHLLTHLNRHCAATRAIFDRHLNPQPAEAAASATSQPTSVRDHVTRLEPSYAATFSERDIARHAELAGRIRGDEVVIVDAAPADADTWRVTIVGDDYPGELSIICGLLFLHGANILSGEVFTYDAAGPKKIVDVFHVRPTTGPITIDSWAAYASELSDLLNRLRAGEPTERVQADLARRIARVLGRRPGAILPLYPIDLAIDNESSDRFTVLRVRATDTTGFLYEFTNALSFCGMDIARVHVTLRGTTLDDTFFITDNAGEKIADPVRQRELRAAVVLIKSFTHLLPHAPDAERALLHFRDLVADLLTRPDWPDEIASLERTEVLDGLARLLGVSDYLWNDLLRMQHANLFPLVRDVDALARPRTAAELQQELAALLEIQTSPLSPLGRGTGGEGRSERVSSSRPSPDSRGPPLTPFPSPQGGEGTGVHQRLVRFRDREMFRVDMRHILGHVAEFGQFSAELTDVAETVIDAGCRICQAELQSQFGPPTLTDGTPCSLTVCALGKLGGQELGFASDIELMFVYAGDGTTTGPRRISNSEFFGRLVEQLLRVLSSPREGIFEIDLRLRPYGRAGSLAVSRESFANYFDPNGPAWPFERQALVKLRPIAGDLTFGDEIVRLRDAIEFSGRPFDVAAFRAMRDRQVRQLTEPGRFNSKMSPGGLVDVEYLVQGLQITHGHRDDSLRATNTLGAMSALAALGVLSADDDVRLRDAYVFLRRLIDALRVVRGNARDLTVPDRDSEEFAFLARRLGYETDPSALQHDLERHTQHVRNLGRLLD
jgi:glutamate-ammonia-ligase adenylyltransferase